jgi:lysozyme
MDDLDYCHLLAQLTRHEGFRLRHYQDTAGKLTVAAKQRPIGAVRAEAVTTTLERDLRSIARQLEDQWPTFHKLDPVRQRVLVHIAFNIGVARLLAQRRLLRAVEGCHWNLAADEMFMSAWGMQDQRRAVVLAEMMRTGRDQFAAATKFRRGEG